MTPLPPTSIAACLQVLEMLESHIDFTSIRTIEDLCAAVATIRGRTIELEPCNMPLKLDGCWFAGETTDYVCYAENAGRLSQEHYVAHELGHILLGHKPIQIDVRAMFPMLDAAVLHSVVMRLRTEDIPPQEAVVEQEAELLGTLLEERLAGHEFPTDHPILWSCFD